MTAPIQKVVIYCVDDQRRLLVFRHLDFPWEQVGVEVPAGTVEAGEDLSAAAHRELCEETGHNCFKIDRYLGAALYDITPLRPEIHERHFFTAHPTGPLPERWESHETHNSACHPGHAEGVIRDLPPAHELTKVPGRAPTGLARDDTPACPIRLECFWIPLEHAHVLSCGQGAMVGRIEGKKGDMNEDQNSVTEWANQQYPNENLKDAVLGLIEETTELAIATGIITRDEAHVCSDTTWENIVHLPKSDEHVQSGLADVQICLYAIANQTGHQVQSCLNWKMDKNRLVRK